MSPKEIFICNYFKTFTFGFSLSVLIVNSTFLLLDFFRDQICHTGHYEIMDLFHKST